MKHKYCALLFISLCALIGCNKNPSSFYQVAMPRNWNQTDLQDRDKNLLGFTQEVVGTLGKEEHIAIEIFLQNVDNLLDGLEKNHYDGVLSTLYPYSFNTKRYAFSDLFVSTGPVLLVPFTSSVHSLKELVGKVIGVERGSIASAMLTTYPMLMTHNYSSSAQALNALVQGEVSGVLMGILPASAFCKDLYYNKIKIATPVLNDEGIRLVTLNKKPLHLIEKFNQGLSRLQKNGTYHELEEKWGL